MKPSRRFGLGFIVVVLASCAFLWWFSGFGNEGRLGHREVENPHVLDARDLPRRSLSEFRGSVDVDEPSPERSPAEPVDSEAAVGETGSLRIEICWADETPVVGAAVALTLPGTADAIVFPARSGQLDAFGRITFEELPAGLVLLSCHPFLWNRAQVVAGELTTKRFVLSRGMQVTGLVVDEDARPIPGATIWLSSGGRGRPIAESDSRGRFSLASIPLEHASVSALAPGYGPSKFEHVRGNDWGDAIEFNLVLRRDWGSLVGQVVDVLGEPIAGAMVELGPVQEDNGFRYRGNHCDDLEQRSDQEGRFFFPSTDAGELLLRVRAPRYSYYEEYLTLRPGMNRRVSLRAAAVVEGCVRNEAGEPVADVVMSSGLPRGLGCFRSSTQANGRYRLECSSDEVVQVRANARGVGEALIELSLSPDEVRVWDPTLDPGRVIRGQLFDKEGKAVPNYFISAASSERKLSGSGEARFHVQSCSGPDGRFDLTNCPDDEFEVKIFSEEHELRERLSHVRPEPSVLLITLDDQKLGSISGRIAADHEFLESVKIQLSGASFGTLQPDPKSGDFHAEGLFPGEYRLMMLLPQRISDESRVRGPFNFKLRRGEKLDLGHVPVTKVITGPPR